MDVDPGGRRVMLTARLLGRRWVVVDGQVVDTAGRLAPPSPAALTRRQDSAYRAQRVG